MDPTFITLAPGTDDDYEFSYRVKKAAEGEYIRRIWGWDEALQRDYHKKHWKEKRQNIISYKDKPIGTLSVNQDEGCLEIGQFFILPEYQNRGIGSCLLERILRKADKAGRVSRLTFLKGNPVASLYKRNGFYLVKETATHCFMEREPHRNNR